MVLFSPRRPQEAPYAVQMFFISHSGCFVTKFEDISIHLIYRRPVIHRYPDPAEVQKLTDNTGGRRSGQEMRQNGRVEG